MPTSTANTKGSVTFKSVTPKLKFEGKPAASGEVTVKHKSGDVTTSLKFTDATARNTNALQDIVLTFDYRYNPKLNFTGAYDFNNNKHKLTANWTGKISDKAASLKSTYTEKDGAVVTEAKLSVSKGVTTVVEFNKTSLQSAKAVLSRGSMTLEPSFDFVANSPSLTATKRYKKYGAVKLSYDVKAENASLEWNKYPWKVTAKSQASSKTFTSPNVTFVYEKVYHI